jgi:hypothetical protein
MYVISLARYGDPPGHVLEGEVYLEEGPGITIVRDTEHNSLRLSSTGGGGEGFLQGLLTSHSAHPQYDIAAISFDQLKLAVSYLNDNLILYTTQQEIYDFKAPHSITIAARRSAQATGTLTTYLALAYGTYDLHNNLNKPHIAFICRANKIYASCANGSNRTEVQIDAAGPFTTRWLRWKRTAAGVEFYEDTALKATITTNIPADQNLLRWIYQVIGTINAPREFYATFPRYSEQ